MLVLLLPLAARALRHAFLAMPRSRSGFFARVLIAVVLAGPGIVRADLPEIIDRVKPSVVVVGTHQLTRSPPFVMRGTGFAVGDGRLVATNHHVIQAAIDEAGGERLVVVARVTGSTMQQRAARIVAVDNVHDLALLRIDGPALPVLSLDEADAVREGQSVAFTGFPIGAVLGLSPVTHRGIISAITPIAVPAANARQINARVVQQIRSGAFDIYQLDATAYPGNSGGPLFELNHGQVIGLLNMVFVKESKESMLSKPSGISFAIPVRFLRELIARGASP